MTALEFEVLQLKTNRRLGTVQGAALAIDRWGGHFNRESDGLPGWQTLRRRLLTRQTLVERVVFSRQLNNFG